MVLCAIQFAVAHEITTPLHIGSTQPMLDQAGAKLLGSAGAPGDVVQVLWASNGVIRPPAMDGSPHPDNAPVEGGLTGVGAHTSPTMADQGIFGLSLVEQRPQNGAKIFVRVFNASSLKRASFYGDSRIFTINGNDVFDVGLVATTNAMDVADPDGDGLVNSWEGVYMSDPDSADTDGDGVSDGDEHRAGTDLLDADSVFAVDTLIRAQGRDVQIIWHSVPGKQYRVEFTSDDLAGHPVFTDVSPVITADNDKTMAVISDGLLLGLGHFRVTLVED